MGQHGIYLHRRFYRNLEPGNHEYDGAIAAAWSCAADANKITVTNHSNMAITATLSYSPGGDFAGVTGSLTKSTVNLATAVGVLPANAPTDSSLLTLGGELDDGVGDKTVIGSVTVTLDSGD